MLMAVPKFGRVKAARLLNQCRISQSKTVGGLSDRQRARADCPLQPRRPAARSSSSPARRAPGKGTLIQARARRGSPSSSSPSRRRRARSAPARRTACTTGSSTDEEFDRRLAAGEFLEYVDLRLGQPLRDAPLRARPDRAPRGKVAAARARDRTARSRVKRARARRGDDLRRPRRSSELERRLRERATESAGEIGERIELARRAARASAGEFDYVVENDDASAPRRSSCGDRRAGARRAPLPWPRP